MSSKSPKKEKKETTRVEVKCPKCDHTEIVVVPTEEIPKCPDHNIKMLIHEVLTEGKLC